MGCGTSKSTEVEEKQIESEMKDCKLSKFDDFFKESKKILETAESIRSGFEDSLQEMYDITSMEVVKDPHTLELAVQVWLWACSAQNKGQISNCTIKFNREAPYLECELGSGGYDVNNFKENLQKYIETVFNSILQIPEILENLKNVMEKAEALKDGIKDDLKSSGLGIMEQAKEISYVAKNIYTLGKGMQRIAGIKGLIEEAKTNISNLIEKIVTLLDTADQGGKKAIEQKAFTCQDIMMKVHPCNKFPQKQIETISKKKECRLRKKKQKGNQQNQGKGNDEKPQKGEKLKENDSVKSSHKGKKDQNNNKKNQDEIEAK